jgi:hypothetical protein
VIRQKCGNFLAHIVATFGKIRHRAGIDGKTRIKWDEGSLHKLHLQMPISEKAAYATYRHKTK